MRLGARTFPCPVAGTGRTECMKVTALKYLRLFCFWGGGRLAALAVKTTRDCVDAWLVLLCSRGLTKSEDYSRNLGLSVFTGLNSDPNARLPSTVLSWERLAVLLILSEYALISFRNEMNPKKRGTRRGSSPFPIPRFS